MVLLCTAKAMQSNRIQYNGNFGSGVYLNSGIVVGSNGVKKGKETV